MESPHSPLGRVGSVQVGRVKPMPGAGPATQSAIDKRAVPGGARLRIGGFEGDEVADRKYHGGRDQAALFFAASSYPVFEVRLKRALAPGSFGENVTVEGFDESVACVGDVCRVGEATIEVATSRSPCATLARHLVDPGIVAAIRAPHRAGWYVRVLDEGLVRPGDAITLVSRPHPGWTVERVAAVKLDKADVEGARALCALKALAEGTKASLAQRLAPPR